MMKKRMYSLQFHIVGFAFLALSLLAWNLLPGMAYAAEKEKDISKYSFSNDPFSDAQWYINNPGQYANLHGIMLRPTESTKDIDMDVVEAWNRISETGIPDRDVVVAIIDTGVDYMHPDLADNMWVNKGEIPDDNIDNDNNGYIDDIYGWDFYNGDATVCQYTYSERYNKNMADPEDNDNHGTHVAGVIAAIANNRTGIAGIASNVNIKIMALKINGGPKGDGDVENAIEAIKYATMMGADICNLSWGTGVYSKELKETMKESDMLFVAAAGNTGGDNDAKPVYPASFKLNNLISVTFVDADGDMTGYSNYGVNSVDIAAPGDDIYSTIVGSYDSMSGSSMAAPQVTAVAALLYAYDEHLYASNIKDIITSNIKELDGLDSLIIHGGIPDAYQAVMAIGKLEQDEEAPEMTFDTIFNKEEMLVPVTVTDNGNSEVRVVKYIYGEKTAEDFQRGINGTLVTDGEAILSKAGKYTFYASDYAGNEIAQVYDVKEDTSAPKLTTTFTVASNYKSRLVTIAVKDTQSGIKRVEYLPGVKKAEDFLPVDAGNIVSVDNGKAQFRVKKDGIYTIFASDNRGNMIAKHIIIKTVKSTAINLGFKSKTLAIGDQLVLPSVIKPSGSTDRIIYKSSNEKVAVVSSSGKVKALAEGKAYITATTASGLSSTCLITVRLKI